MSEIDDRGIPVEDPDEEEEEHEEEGDEGSEGGFSPILKLLLLVVLLGGLVTGAYFVTQKLIIPKLSSSETVQDVKKRLNQPKKEKPKKKGPVIRHQLLGITANLAGPRRNLVSFDLMMEIYSEDAQEELIDKEFQIRDALLIYFRARSLQEISTRQFLVTVRDTLKRMLNSTLEGDPVDTVYFTKFIVQ